MFSKNHYQAWGGNALIWEVLEIPTGPGWEKIHFKSLMKRMQLSIYELHRKERHSQKLLTREPIFEATIYKKTSNAHTYPFYSLYFYYLPCKLIFPKILGRRILHPYCKIRVTSWKLNAAHKIYREKKSAWRGPFQIACNNLT